MPSKYKVIFGELYFEVLLSDLLFFYGNYELFCIYILFWNTIITFIINLLLNVNGSLSFVVSSKYTVLQI